MRATIYVNGVATLENERDMETPGPHPLVITVLDFGLAPQAIRDSPLTEDQRQYALGEIAAHHSPITITMPDQVP